MNQIIWIDWAYLGRSQNLANRLGAKYYSLNYFSAKPQRMFFLFRYLLASTKTISLLISQKPATVIMTGSPPFPHFIVYFLSKFKKMKYVIDTHSGYFDDPKFQILPRLRKKVLENAFFHIVTNDVHKNIVESNNGKAVIVGALIENNDSIKGYEFKNDKNIVLVSSYSSDEPLDIIFDVASKMPDVTIYITGNEKKASKAFISKCKSFPNIVLTGFLPTEKYISYIKGSTAVMALTTRDNTMQRGAYEALSYKVPVITSNWLLLRQSFYKGAVHIDNTAIDLERAINKVCSNIDEFKTEIAELNSEYTQTFESRIHAIRKTLQNVM